MMIKTREYTNYKRICVVCKKEFITKNYAGKTCSPICLHERLSKTQSARYNKETIKENAIKRKQRARKNESVKRKTLPYNEIKRRIYNQEKIGWSNITDEMIAAKKKHILIKRQKVIAIKTYREANPLPPKELTRTCIICSKVFDVKGKSLVCSTTCKNRDTLNKYYANHDVILAGKRAEYVRAWQAPDPFICKECGEFHQPKYGDKATVFCSPTCRVRDERRRGRYSKGAFKRYKAEQAGERFKVMDIYERDRWVCGICHGKVNKHFKYPHPMSASLDHIIAIAEGGTHTRVNVQLAHLECNVSIGVGGVKQLRMFG